MRERTTGNTPPPCAPQMAFQPRGRQLRTTHRTFAGSATHGTRWSTQSVPGARTITSHRKTGATHAHGTVTPSHKIRVQSQSKANPNPLDRRKIQSARVTNKREHGHQHRNAPPRRVYPLSLPSSDCPSPCYRRRHRVAGRRQGPLPSRALRTAVRRTRLSLLC